MRDAKCDVLSEPVRIGLAPGTIAAAVWEGRRYAAELQAPTDASDITPYRREVTALAP